MGTIYRCRSIYGMKGKTVTLEDTIAGFKAILEGEYDSYNEAAFFMVGGIDEVKAKAEKMAAESKAFQADSDAKETGGQTSKKELTWDEARNNFIKEVEKSDPAQAKKLQDEMPEFKKACEKELVELKEMEKQVIKQKKEAAAAKAKEAAAAAAL